MARLEKLKAPFPYHGGKSKVAALIWDRIGNVDNYIEPFFGSGAVLLLRPSTPNVETLNDYDCYVANFWRSTKHDPEAVVEHADAPVSECCLHANHRWLVLSNDAVKFRQLMRTDPDYFDPKVAGRWVHGLCCWIGSGWCQEPKDKTKDSPGGSGNKRPDLGGKGVHAAGEQPLHQKRPRTHREGGSLPRVLSQQIPRLGGNHDRGVGIHAHADLPQSMPDISGESGASGRGVHKKGGLTESRPQLADTYDIGRGVHSNGIAGTCAERRAWLLDWFGRLRDRLRTVRTCCADWSRVCSSESTTTRLGLTGVFLDPPYGYASGRAKDLYAADSGTVAGEVLKWCLANGLHKDMRICLAGYDNEGHAGPLEAAGWSVVEWKADGGYGNRTAKGRANRLRERLWFSPNCLNQPTLWDYQEPV